MSDTQVSTDIDIATEINRFREKLLDLSNRNPLLNYRKSKRRTLQIIDELPNQIFSRLVVDNKSFHFDPLPEEELDDEESLFSLTDSNISPPISSNREVPGEEPTGSNGDELPSHPDSEQPLQRKHSDDHLQTNLTAKKLDPVVNFLRRQAESAIQETGVNYLFLALGMLHWKVNEYSDREQIAPLILIPAQITRSFSAVRNRYEYMLSWREEELQYNICLAKLLDNDFGIVLPEYDGEELPEEYFARVRQAITAFSEWTVRREALLGFFSFQKLLMYLDIDPDSWQRKGALSESSLVGQIIAGRQIEQGVNLYASDYDIDEKPEAHDIPIIADADSSQHSALVDINDGKSLVIEGPPGTGKSQTIANAIAATIYKGKTVLFVAEKLAALKVVSDKLRGLKLGNFCLELHSDAVSPRKVFKSLEDRLSGKFRQPLEIETTLNSLERKKKLIKEYLAASSVLVGPYRKPLYEVIWQVVDLRATGIQSLRQFTFDTSAKQTSFEENIDLLETFADTFDEIASPRQSPWWGFWASTLNPIHCQPIQDCLRELQVIQNETALKINQLNEEYGEGLIAWLLDNRKIHSGRIPQLDSIAKNALSLPRTEDLSVLESAGVRKLARRFAEVVEKANQLLAITEPYLLSERSQVETLVPQLDELITKRLGPVFPQQKLGDLQLTKVKLKALLDVLSNIKGAVNALGSQELGPIRNLKEYESAEYLFKLFRHPIVAHLNNLPKSLFLANSVYLFQQGKSECETFSDKQEELVKYFHWPSIPEKEQIEEITQKLRPHIRSWLRFLKKDYRWAKKELTLFWRAGIGSKPQQWLTHLEELESWLFKTQKFQERSDYRSAFGEVFQGRDTNWEDVKTLLNWRATVEKQGLYWDAATDLLNRRDNSVDTRQVVQQRQDLQSELADPKSLQVLGLGEDFCNVRFFTIVERAETLLADIERFEELSRDLAVTPELTLQEVGNRLQSIEDAANNRSEACSHVYQQELGSWCHALDTDTHALRAAADWMEQLSASELPEKAMQKCFGESPADSCRDLVTRFEAIAMSAAQWDEQRQSLSEFGTLNDAWMLLFDSEGSVESTDKLLCQLRERIKELPGWSAFCRSLMHCQQKNLQDITNLALSDELDPSKLSNCYRLSVLERVVEGNLWSSHSLKSFSRQKLEKARKQFRTLDHELVKMNQALIAHKAAMQKAPEGNNRGRVGEYTDMGLVRHEITKQRSHCRIRDLLSRAGTAVKSLKPCFMMSPLSIAQFLDPEGVEFDLVIMDEASQIKPEDALGTVLRAKQLVVVGDPKQLPPTSFFDKVGDDVADEEATQFDNTESILEVAMKAFQPVRRLRWHYRSQHESLIHFSNDRFYDGDLVVFPSASTEASRLGVHHHYVENATFSKGYNVQEAETVAKAVVDHARLCPKETLGVATFNQKQRDLIQDCLDRICEQDSMAREAIVALDEKQEDIFIKNLENLQGDERDVIFISYTYESDPDSGQVHNRFGPITGEFGWRRLNVLITRARRRVEVFSSMLPTDIRGGPDKSRGVNSMKDYLEFVKMGVLPDRGVRSDRGIENPFELSIARVISGMGLEVVPQVGVAGYFIDLGIVRPGNSGDFLLGVECDGATYHSSKSARDRDRLREEVISKRGWKLHRVWSTDWFLNQQHEEDRLQQAILKELSND